MPLLSRSSSYRPNFKVLSGSSARSVALIQDRFGVNIDLIGKVSAEEANRMARAAADAKVQLANSTAFVKHFKKIVEYTKEIEKLREEAQAAGLKAAKEIDEYVCRAFLNTHGHELHIQQMAKKFEHGRDILDAQAAVKLRVAEVSLQERLREIRASGGEAESAVRARAVNSARAAKKTAQARSEHMAFINGGGYNPWNGSRGGGALSGWRRAFS